MMRVMMMSWNDDELRWWWVEMMMSWDDDEGDEDEGDEDEGDDDNDDDDDEGDDDDNDDDDDLHCAVDSYVDEGICIFYSDLYLTFIHYINFDVSTFIHLLFHSFITLYMYI